jgi:mono/diheme cytochrome c family protein
VDDGASARPEATSEPVPVVAPEVTHEAATTPSGNPGAKIFLQKCTGCHTVGAGNLSGPDLKPTITWPRADLEAAIVRMEKSVGPLDPAEIGALADLLLSPDGAGDIAAAQQQLVLAQTATLDPPSPEKGRALFHGQATFTNGGVSCAACHEAGGRGGNLAVELHTSFSRLGELPLKSAMENPGLPLMKAVYATRPITPQESVHVAAYLETLADQPMRASNPPLQAAGMGIAALALGGIGVGYRKRLRGVRADLVRRANGKRR